MINLYKDEIKGINYILGDNFDSGLCDFSESRISRATNCNLFGIPIEAPDWADSSYFRGNISYYIYMYVVSACVCVCVLKSKLLIFFSFSFLSLSLYRTHGICQLLG